MCVCVCVYIYIVLDEQCTVVLTQGSDSALGLCCNRAPKSRVYFA